MRLERPRLPLLQTSHYTPPFATTDQLVQGVSQAQDQPLPVITVDPSEYGSFQETPSLLVGDEHPTQPPLLGPSINVGPSISIIPPTPMERQTSQDYKQMNSPLMMNSNTSSPINVVPPSPRLMMSRKPLRFMMGPRVDCEKCRLGVKGHFVHLE
jgi:hypothetical protein